MNVHFFALAIATTTACIPPPERPQIAALPPHVSLDLQGTFALSASGELTLKLLHPCSSERALDSGAENTAASPRRHKMGCSREELDAIEIIAETPWHEKIRGTWLTPASIVFRPGWSPGAHDLLGDGPVPIAGGAWSVAGESWTPSPAEVQRIFELATGAESTDASIARGGAPAKLAIRAIEVAGGSLHPGRRGVLRVTVANSGSGTAYRVVATTRSSLEPLHERRLMFGAIRPGVELGRQVAVEIPPGETAPDAMIVVEVTEADGHAPANATKRIPLAAGESAASATISCSAKDQKGPSVNFDPGEATTLRCSVHNTSDVPAMISIEVSVASGARTRTPPQSIASGVTAQFEVPMTPPRQLNAGSQVDIVAIAIEATGKQLATATVSGTVAKRKLCKRGALTRAQYSAKLRELRAAMAAGDLTQGELDKYDAELLTCLK